MLRLDGRWVWDFWFAEDGGLTHVFYLQAPRSLGDPERRHRNARLGHAVSSDLVSWEVLPDPLPIGPAGAWDDLATWTGSIIRGPDRTWSLFYTGCSTRDDGLVQRIGLATSADLLHWERFGEAPLIVADPRWYELLDLDSWHDQAWRDPWVMEDPEGNGYHALITARARSGDPAGRGVIAHAVSPDLRSWEVRPPFDLPAGFGQLEVPQVVVADGHPILAFCAGAQDVARIPAGTPARAAQPGGPTSAECQASSGHTASRRRRCLSRSPIYTPGSSSVTPGPGGSWASLGLSTEPLSAPSATRSPSTRRPPGCHPRTGCQSLRPDASPDPRSSPSRISLVILSAAATGTCCPLAHRPPPGEH